MFVKRFSYLILFLLTTAWLLSACAPANIEGNVISEPVLVEENSITTTEPAGENVQSEDESLAAAPELDTAAAVAGAFYHWYLDYVGDPATENFKNPLVDQAYQTAPYLSTSFVQHMDEVLADMKAEFGGYTHDPFLCAQAIPTQMTTDITFQRGEVASVLMRSSFPNHVITVDLYQNGGKWTITNITCASSPEGSAKAFYTWYLGYIGDRSSGDFNNPLVDKAYQDHLLLAPEFVQTVDETLAGFEQGGFDPFLLAQDIPQDFTVDPGVEPGTAVVHLQFSTQCVNHLLVETKQVGSLWPITAITEDEGLPVNGPTDETSAEPAEETNNEAVPVFQDETNGFSFSYPLDWVLEPLNLAGPGQPEDWPVEVGWLLMTPEIATSLSAGSPPDPTAPVVVAPINIEVLIGTEVDLERVYGPLDGETGLVSNLEVIQLWRDPGYTHMIFQHPLRPDTWVIITDWVTEFPGREEQATEAAPAMDMVLSSLQFKP